MITCSKRFFFEAGHRLKGHNGKCQHLHGHSYEVIVTVGGEIRYAGMVLDFGDMKELIGSWLDDSIDHSVIVWDQDTELKEALGKLPGQKIYWMNETSTVENIASVFYSIFAARLTSKVKLISVEVKETRDSSAVCIPGRAKIVYEV